MIYYNASVYGETPYVYQYAGTVTAGSLTATINTAELSENSVVEVLTSDFGAQISDVEADTTAKTVTVTIPVALEADLGVLVVVTNK